MRQAAALGRPMELESLVAAGVVYAAKNPGSSSLPGFFVLAVTPLHTRGKLGGHIEEMHVDRNTPA